MENWFPFRVIGGVRPSDGVFSSLVVPHCDTAVFQLFLDSLAQENPPKVGIRSSRDRSCLRSGEDCRE